VKVALLQWVSGGWRAEEEPAVDFSGSARWLRKSGARTFAANSRSKASGVAPSIVAD
jgi:hypothetical protein